MNEICKEKLIDDIKKASSLLDYAIANYEKSIYARRSVPEKIQYRIYNDWPIGGVFLLGVIVGITAIMFLR